MRRDKGLRTWDRGKRQSGKEEIRKGEDRIQMIENEIRERKGHGWVQKETKKQRTGGRDEEIELSKKISVRSRTLSSGIEFQTENIIKVEIR